MVDRRTILLTLLTSPLFPIAAQGATPGADTFISNLADQALQTLGDKSLSATARGAKFRQLFLTNFAVQRISRFVLGRYWRQATPAQRRDYVQLFTKYIIAVYVDRLTQYSGLKVHVVGTRRAPNGGVLVETKVVRPGAPKPAQVAWRLEGQPGAYKVVDVAIEGVSMAITERQEFGSVIANHGGNVNALLVALRHRISASAQN
jgi:phospholipid transport system substrate-binding protein